MKELNRIDNFSVVRKWSDLQLFTGIFLASKPDIQTMFVEFIKRNISEKKIKEILENYK